MNTKKCTKCGNELPATVEYFYRHTQKKDGLSPECKECTKQRSKRYREANPEKARECCKEWREANPEKERERHKKYREANREKTREYDKKWREANREKERERHKKYREANRDKIRENSRKRREANPDKIREYDKKWREANREKTRGYSKKWREANRDRKRERDKKWFQANPDKVRGYNKKWREANPEKAREYSREWQKKNKGYDKKRRDAEPSRRINDSIKNVIGVALRGEKHGRHWEDLVGYTLSDLMRHLESLFTEGMTWGKLLNGEIHIDHIIPKSAFNFTKPEHEDFKRCWVLENLQPMWASQNMSKHKRIDGEFQPSLAI